MEATFLHLLEFESVSAELSHTSKSADCGVAVWGMISVPRGDDIDRSDLDKQHWSAVYLWLEVQSTRVGDPLDYSEQTCPLMATWYNVTSPSAMWTQHAESWPGFISPGDGLFCIVCHELVLFSQLMTAAANIKLTHAERDFRLFARGFKRKKWDIWEKRGRVPFLMNFQVGFSEQIVTIQI